MKKTVVILATLTLLLAFAAVTQAESNPLSLGTVTPGSVLGSCSGTSIPNSSMFGSNMTCQDITVSCPTIQGQAISSLHAIFGYYAPTSGSNGTIVLFSGGDGTMPEGPQGEEVQYANYYEGQSYTVVQIEWASAWQDPTNGSGGNILAAACRPATFLNWVSSNSTTHTLGKAFCAQGASAGSTAIVYPLAWYGASTWSGIGSSPLSAAEER